MNFLSLTNFLRRVLLSIILGLGCASAQAQTAAPSYPVKPIHLVVGYTAGGGLDAIARLMAPRLAALLGQQVVVENRAGASGLIGATYVAKAAPDGYTLLLGESGLLISQHLQAQMPFDALKSFLPVAGLFVSPLMIVAGNDFPAKTPKELLTLLKSQPGKYSYATAGVGSVQFLGFEMLKAQIGAFVVHIPYRGAAQIVPDVIGGQVPIGVVSVSAGMAQVKTGKLRALALMSPVKLAGAEDVAPLSDALPGFNVAPRQTLLVPAGTPAAVIERLTRAVQTVLASPELIQAASLQGAIPAFMEPGALALDLVRESADWGRIIKSQKISLQ